MDKKATKLTQSCDVLVVGTGVAGLSAAVTAGKLGLDVMVIEKDTVFGGTTAFSGGVLWIPGSRQAKEQGIVDTKEAARTYLKEEAGNHYNERVIESFLENGPRMLEFFEKNTEFKCVLYQYPDYHPDEPGGVMRGRSLVPETFDARRLGPELKRLRKPLRTITFMGMQFSSSNNDLKHFFNATRSIVSFLYVVKRLTRHVTELIRYGRGIQITGGNAVVGRLAKSAFDLKIPIRTGMAAKELIVENGIVKGVVAEKGGKTIRITARRGVVLATGGFARDVKRLASLYPHVKRGGEEISPTPPGIDTGDGIRMAEAIGANFEDSYPNAAAWIPASKVPIGKESYVFPHLVDRYKPGFIIVNRGGKRFCNEADSYHDVGAAMIKTCENDKETVAWEICDHRAIRKYGMGFAKPAPVPVFVYVNSGYLVKGRTIRELAQKTGIDPDTLEETVQRFNIGAQRGRDLEFHRGESAYNRYLGDADHKPNPCVAPIKDGPFYAVKLYMGDLGTFDGLKTDEHARVLNTSGQPIPGLYAAGNEMASVMGGSYPGAGITIGPGATFGYVAAQHIARLDIDTTLPTTPEATS